MLADIAIRGVALVVANARVPRHHAVREVEHALIQLDARSDQPQLVPGRFVAERHECDLEGLTRRTVGAEGVERSSHADRPFVIDLTAAQLQGCELCFRHNQTVGMHA